MEKILVSACLRGVNCREDGISAARKKMTSLVMDKYVIFAGPEQLGGLTTPRPKNKSKGDGYSMHGALM